MDHHSVKKMRAHRLYLPLLAALLAGQLIAQAPEVATRGKDFWCGFMQNGTGTMELRLQIASLNGTSGTVSIPGTGWSTNYTVGANGVATIIVPNTAENLGSENVRNIGVRVQSLDSVTVTATNYQQSSTDATQILPVSSLGTAYRAEGFSGVPNWGLPNQGDTYTSELLVVATEDGTQVRITPSAATRGGHPVGVPFVVALNAGQTYQVQALNGSADVTGTSVVATDESGACRPFAVFAGSMCGFVPVNCGGACDHLYEQMTPVNAWGTRFHTAPLQGPAYYAYRVTADQNGTQVTLDGGAPMTLNAGQTYQAMNVSDPVCIASDLPVSVTQFMQSYQCAGVGNTPAAGDPSSVQLFPDDRMSTRAVFATSSSSTQTHHATVIVPSGAVGTLTLDGTPVSNSAFSSYINCPGMSYAKMTLTTGTHRLACPSGFLAYVYGATYGESYLFGASSRALPTQPPAPVICSDAQITLTTPITLENIAWTTASAPSTILATTNSYTFTPDHNDVYRVDGTLPVSGCPKHFEFQVGMPVQPVLDIQANGAITAQVCQYGSVQLHAQPTPDPAWFNLTWTPANDLNDATSPDPVAYPSADTWYRLSVVSPVGCGSALDSVLVTVRPSDVYAVHASVTDDSICQGNQTTLQVKAERPVRSDVFDGAAAPWWNIQGGTISNICGAVSGTSLYFSGAGNRSASTGPVDLSAGGVAHFALKVASGATPCDDAEPGEDVVLEYSINGGGNWTPLATLNEALYPSFTNLAVEVPALGVSAVNALVRWRQVSNSGAGQDNWALDNVVVTRYDNAGLTFNWSPAASVTAPSSATTTATPLANTLYHVSTVTPSGCTYTDSVQVTVAPAFSIVPIADTTRCGLPGTQLHAQVTSGSNIQWAWSPNNGSLDHPNAPDPIATPAATTAYTVQATNSIGCLATENVQVTVSRLTALAVSTIDNELCATEQTQLQSTVTSTGPYSITWSPAAGLSDVHAAAPTAQPSATTNYLCTVTDNASGCVLSGTQNILVHGPYHLDLPNDTTVCTALGHQLDVTHDVPGTSTILWSPASHLNAVNIAQPSIMQDTSTTYHVTVTDAFGCSVTDSVRINVAFDDLLTPVHVGTCTGQPLVLDAGFPGSTYDWTTGDHSQTITVYTAGSYTTTITDAQFCQAIKTFVAAFAPLPPVDLGPDTMLCGVSSYVIDAHSPGNGLLWSTSEHTQQITVTSSGTYSVLSTSPQGCQSTGEVQVTMNPLPVDNLQDVTRCISDPPVLDAGNTGSAFTWGDNTHGQTFPPHTSGTYSVTVTTPEGCSDTFDAVVTLMPQVHVDLGPDTALCANLALVLDAGSPALTHTWNTGEATQTIAPTASDTFSVVVSNGYCTDNDSIVVRFDPLPVDALQDVTACVDQPVTLHAGNAGSTYLWDNGVQTEDLLVPDPGGLRTVTVTTADGCTGHFDAQVSFVAYPVVDLGPDTVLCEGQVLHLDALNTGAQYTWSDGSHDQTLTVLGTGTYTVSVDNGHCATTDAVLAIFNPTPMRAPVHQLFTCMDEDPHAVAVDAGNENCTYAWSTGQTGQVIMATEYGWHAVTITNAYGCSIRDSIMVNEFCPPSLFLPNTFTPNGDGLNDYWGPVGNNVADLDLYVFDRWGGLVFHATDLSQTWDGTINGSPAKNDVYAWRISYRFIEKSDGSLGFEHKELGHVQVLR